MLTSSMRAHRVTSERSEALQDAEAVLALVRYDLGRAGFRGVEDGTFTRNFAGCSAVLEAGDLGSGSSCLTIRVDEQGEAGDAVTVQFFETEHLLGLDDSGERRITYLVDRAELALSRQEVRQQGVKKVDTTELLVGNVNSLRVIDLVDRSRDVFPLTELRRLKSDGTPWPEGLREQLAGLNLEITFADGSSSVLLVGLHNPQLFDID